MTNSEARGKMSPIDNVVASVAYSVIENLPDTETLKKMGPDEKKTLLIGNRELVLRVYDDEAIVSNGNKGKIKQIMLTDESNSKGKTKFGIFTDEDFNLLLGSVLKNIPVYFTKPINLKEIREELNEDNKRRITRSLAKTNSIERTAVNLNLRPDYVSNTVRLLNK